ncbi:MAG: alpha/beta fold hydrolase [Rhodocyclaceae bacterium]|nr:alpha/beta fold hydrolase [Rhodocyclaceae bacterium]
MRPPLMLLHGWGTTPASWHPLLAALSDPCDRLTPALPGHPGGPAADGTLDAWAEAMLPAASRPVDLCGWSLGGLLAIALAASRPQQVRRLVLIGTSPSFARRPGWSHGLPDEDIAAFQAEFASDPQALMKRFTALQAVGDDRRRAVTTALRSCLPALPPDPAPMGIGLRLLRDSDLGPRLAAIACPVRLLHGSGDALMPASGATALADALPDARLTLLEDCGHAPQLSRPADCAALIDGFLDD